MPLNSADIAASAGQFQQLYASNQQYSNMVGGMSTMQGSSGQQAEQITGGLMNRGAAIGAPIASLAIGLAGMDPMSLGLKAGMGAYAGGAGLMGGAAMGLGVAGAAAVPMMAAQYAGSQMWAGAQGQQQFNQGMRGAFSFMSPHGQGFSTGQMGGINQGLFNMAGQQGGNGDMMGIRELQGLATNMGRMGMGGGVKDVTSFTQKFREMVDTLKVVAKEMGTSMQAAQEFVVAMKGSGIFNSGDQKRLATEIRQFSQAGNLATSELTAAANIGAQVSRAVGGRGRQGAFAGIRTLGNIGAAMTSGVLTEEDIYNATGQTGAEGRQALAARQLEQSGNFLRTGRGRMFLASVAGANGQLDPGSVQDWLSGDMGIGQTRGQAKKNLGQLGKAGFLRNEGKLRGAALEQFGGLMPAMALQQWAQSKGIDINTMDDKSMLFASRQLGMGMDELEDAVKMSRNMPRIMEQQRSSTEMGNYQTKMAAVRKTQGIEGVQRRFEEARGKVEGSLQRTGAQFYTDLSSMVDRYINELTGTAVEEYDQKVQDAYHDAMAGGGTGGLARQLGIGKGAPRAGLGGKGGIGGSIGSGAGVNQFFGRSTGTAALIRGGMNKPIGDFLFGGQSDMDRMREAGYGGLFKGVGGADDLQKRVNMAQDAYNSTRQAANDPSMSGVHGQAKLENLTQLLAVRAAAGDKGAAAALMNLKSAGTKEERLEIAKKMLADTPPPTVNAALGGGFATKEAGDQAYATAFRGKTGLSAAISRNQSEAHTLTDIFTLGGSLLGRKSKEYVDRAKGGLDVASSSELGEYIRSEEGKGLIMGIAGGDQQSRDKVEDMLLKTNLPPAKREALQRMAAAADAADLMKDGHQPTEAEWADLAKKRGLTLDDVKNSATSLGAVASGFYDDHRKQLVREISKDARDRSLSLRNSGFATVDKSGFLTVSNEAGLAITKALGVGKGSQAVLSALQTQMDVTQTQSGFGQGTDREAILASAQQYGASEEALMNLSVADQRKVAKALEASGFSDQAARFRGMAGTKAKIQGQLKRGGGVQALGSALGVGFKSRAELTGLQSLAKKDSGAAVGQLLTKAGIGSDAFSDEEQAQLAGMLKSGDVNQLSNLAAGRGELGRKLQTVQAEAAHKQSEEQDRAKNPLMDQMEKHLSEIKDSLTGQGDVAGHLGDISKNTSTTATNTAKPSPNSEGGGDTDQPAQVSHSTVIGKG